MTQQNLTGKTIAILSTIGVESVELTQPQNTLEQAGAKIMVLSPSGKKIKSLEFPKWGEDIDVDGKISDAQAADFDAVYLPGGIINPDILRTDKNTINLIKEFAEQKKPIISMCHGPSILITANLVDGKKITSWPSIKIDLQNAGATWLNNPTVLDGNLLTARSPEDIPQLNTEMIKLIAAS